MKRKIAICPNCGEELRTRKPHSCPQWPHRWPTNTSDTVTMWARTPKGADWEYHATDGKHIVRKEIEDEGEE